MKAGSKEVIREAEIFFGIFDHELSECELGDFLSKQGFEGESCDVRDCLLWKRIDRFWWVYRYLPFVKMVAVCNAVAMNTADGSSDIDLFFIVRKGRMFLARTIATVVFHALGIRRHGKKVAGRFCLTFFVSDESLSLKGIVQDRDVYLKYWLLTLKPLYGERMLEKFFKANGVVYDSGERLRRKAWVAGLFEWLLGGGFGGVFEGWLRSLHVQRWERLRSEIGDKHGIIVSDDMLKFHNIDMREHFREEFEKRGGRYVDTISFS